MTYTERFNRTAISIKQDGSVKKMSRMPFMSGSFSEAWLQELLADNPFIIPSSDIGFEYAPLVCIGREVPVGKGETQGYIDNLYVTPSGRIVIVETKLFRNQEARRTVVAQIIDYAKELQKWDCEKLDEVAADYYFKKEGQAFRMIDIMARHGYLSLNDGASFTDRVNLCLKKSSFLLMIIGDGIRSSVEQLADFLNENSSMSFNMGLAEMEIYKQDNDLVVIPHLITKTSVVERFVVVTDFEEEKEEIVSRSEYIKKPILTRREFIDVFSDNGGYDPDVIGEFISDMEAINGLTVGISPTELTIRFSPENGYSYALLTFSIGSNHADMWVMPGRIKSNLEKHGKFPFEADEFLDFYKHFVDVNRCKYAPYENISGFYFADIDEVLLHKKDFISAAERFMISIQ